MKIYEIEGFKGIFYYGYIVYMENETGIVYISAEQVMDAMEYDSIDKVYQLVKDLCVVFGIKQDNFIKKNKLIELDYAITMLAGSIENVRYRVIFDLIRIEKELYYELKGKYNENI